MAFKIDIGFLQDFDQAFGYFLASIIKGNSTADPEQIIDIRVICHYFNAQAVCPVSAFVIADAPGIAIALKSLKGHIQFLGIDACHQSLSLPHGYYTGNLFNDHGAYIPEGGWFQEVFRSGKTVYTPDGRSRSALTHIYFSLKPAEVSRFHRVASDEIWNLYQGSGLNLYIWDGASIPPICITLSAGNNCFCYVIPVGTWQAAEPISDAVPVGCSVAPGFDFSDFTLIDPDSEEAKRLICVAPEMARYALSVNLKNG